MDLASLLGQTPRRRLWCAVAGVAIGVSALLPVVLGTRSGHTEKGGDVLVVHGFSILEDAFKSGLAPAFRREWTERTGGQIGFASTFSSLGSVTNDLLRGLPADLAFLSPEFGARQLIGGGVLPTDALERLPQQGVFTETPLVLVVRPGNPRGITDYSDLKRPGLKIVCADAGISGAGYWAILAAYGSAWRRSGRPQDGYEELLGIWRNVSRVGASARVSRALFQDGPGDALMTYEQDALWGIRSGELKAEIVYPRSTIVAEVCLGVIARHIEPAEEAGVQAFSEFLWSPAAQQVLREHGFRGRTEAGAAAGKDFPVIEDPFRIRDLGGWKHVRTEILEGAWRSVQREAEGP